MWILPAKSGRCLRAGAISFEQMVGRTPMQGQVDRPLGISALAVLMASEGIVSLITAVDLVVVDLARVTPTAEAVAGVEFITGLALVYKAHGLWTRRWTAWLLTLLVVILNGAGAALEIALGPPVTAPWATLALATIVGLYLLQPGVRAAFSADQRRP